jgi:1-acyl-sn-glycerol-3-phosphate acyltransferase
VISLWGRTYFWFARGILFALAKVLLRLRIEGRRNVPRRGPLIVACNHVSHLDPPVVGSSVPRLVINMAKRELFKIGWLEKFMGSIGTIMVDRGRGKQALLDGIEALKHGYCLMIFPEGTRSVSGVLSKGHSGAIVMAIRTGAPLLPAAIIGSEKALGKGTKRLRRVPVTVRFGEPYRIAYDGDVELVPRAVLDRECFLLMERIEALLPEQMRPTPEQKREWYGGLAS